MNSQEGRREPLAGDVTGQPRRTPATVRHPFRLLLLTLLTVSVAGGAGWWSRGRYLARSPTEAAAGPASADDPAERGRLLYQVNCSQCHGPEGHGDGPAA